MLNPTRRRCVARTVPGLVFVLAAAVLGATPGQAAPAGALGAEMTLSTLSTTGGTRGNQVANLPDGTTVVAWTSGTGAKVFVRRRGRGRTLGVRFGPTQCRLVGLPRAIR